MAQNKQIKVMQDTAAAKKVMTPACSITLLEPVNKKGREADG